MANMTYINAFLNRDGVEGPCVTRGYIPANPRNFYGDSNQNPAKYKAIGASGVTIATGCDLGQTDCPSLRGYGVPEDLVTILMPYIGRRKSNAIQMLRQKPLVISRDAAELLDLCVHNGYLDRYVRPAYEKYSRFPFDNLPNQAQAVVFSVCFQKGCGGVRRDWPKLWSYLVSRNWKAASNELLYGFKTYKLRRSIEGTLLKEII